MRNELNRIFIVGCPRSGTTLLQSLLYATCQLSSFPESHFFDKVFFKFTSNYRRKPNYVSVIKKFFEELKIEIEIENFNSYELTNTSLINKFISILDKVSIREEKKMWVEKTPDHLHRVSLIEKNVNNSKFIHIVRRPYPTILSLSKASSKWGEGRSHFTCSLKWILCLFISYVYKNKKNHYLIFYEELALDTNNVMIDLCQWLDLDWKRDFLNNFSHNIEEITSKNESWKSNNWNNHIKYDDYMKNNIWYFPLEFIYWLFRKNT
jgi:sulfotransferase family protein